MDHIYYMKCSGWSEADKTRKIMVNFGLSHICPYGRASINIETAQSTRKRIIISKGCKNLFLLLLNSSSACLPDHLLVLLGKVYKLFSFPLFDWPSFMLKSEGRKTISSQIIQANDLEIIRTARNKLLSINGGRGGGGSARERNGSVITSGLIHEIRWNLSTHAYYVLWNINRLVWGQR